MSRVPPVQPAARLRGVAYEYRAYSDDSRRSRIQREFACSVVPLMLEFASGWHVSSQESSFEPRRLRAFVAGPSNTYALTVPAGAVEGIQVDLSPLGARRLLRMPMYELANRVVSLDDVVGDASAFLIEVLQSTPTWPERFAVLDTALSHRLEYSGAVSPGVEWAWEEMRRSHGQVPIGELCAELGWSRKRLVARFREDVGLTPKIAARVLRFEHLKRRLSGTRRGPESWADLAGDCGYADQAHLAREVREMTGMTPTDLLHETFLQDGIVAAA